MDLKSFAETYWSMQEGKVNPGLQAYLDKKKGKKENGDDDKKENGDDKENGNGKESKGSKPDFLDLDKDGDKKEPMKKAAKEKKEETEYNYVNTYLDELKKTTMGSYIKKAAIDATNRSFDHGESEKRQYEPDKEDEKEEKKIANRVKGISRAAKKLTKEETVAEHHQKDADGNTIPHEEEAAGTPSSIEERTVLEQLTEDGREIDAFEAVISYLLDEGFAENWEHAEKIMTTLNAELVEEVYQSQLIESEKLARAAYERAQKLGAKRRRSSDPSGIYKSERAGYNLAQSQRSHNASPATQGGNQTGGGPKDFGFARHKKNPVKSKSVGDTGGMGHQKKADTKITMKKDGKTPLKTPRYKYSTKQRDQMGFYGRMQKKDPKNNPKHEANKKK